MIKKQVVIVGLGRFGTSVALNLARKGHEIMAIDIKEENLHHISNKVARCINADIKNQDVLDNLNLSDIDAAIIGIGEDIAASVISVITMRNAGIPTIVAKAKDDTHATILTELGATKTIFPERDTGNRVANNLFSDNILDLFQLSDDYSITEIVAPKSFHNKTVEEIGVRQNHKINIIAIRTGSNINAEIKHDTQINENDSLYIVGSKKAIDKFKSIK